MTDSSQRLFQKYRTRKEKKNCVLWYQSELMLASFAVFSWAICLYNTPSKIDLLLFCFFYSLFIWPTITDRDDLTNSLAWRANVIFFFRSILIHMLIEQREWRTVYMRQTHRNSAWTYHRQCKLIVQIKQMKKETAKKYLLFVYQWIVWVEDW